MPEGNQNRIVVASIADDGSLTVVGDFPMEDPFAVTFSGDGRTMYYYRNLWVGSVPIGADGMPSGPAVETSWDGGSAPSRLRLRPRLAPTASFDVTPGEPGTATTFDASGSERAVRYEWDFGDGQTQPDGGTTPSHTYAQPGKGRRAKRGAKIVFQLNTDADVKLEVAKISKGVKTKGHCRPIRKGKPAKGKPCQRVRTVGDLETAGVQGRNQIPFNGKIEGRRLKPGKYRLSGRATVNGLRSNPVKSKPFRVVRR